jgi:hypothetical protein
LFLSWLAVGGLTSEAVKRITSNWLLAFSRNFKRKGLKAVNTV